MPGKNIFGKMNWGCLNAWKKNWGFLTDFDFDHVWPITWLTATAEALENGNRKTEK